MTDLEWLISTDSNSALKGGKKRDICFRIKAVISQEKNSGMYTAMYTVVSPSGEEERWQYTPNGHFDIARAAGEVALEVAKRGMEYAQPLYDNAYIDHIPLKAAEADAAPRATVPASQPKQQTWHESKREEAIREGRRLLVGELRSILAGYKPTDEVVLTVLDDEDGVMADISINYDNGRKSKMLLFAEPRMVDVTDDEDE